MYPDNPGCGPSGHPECLTALQAMAGIYIISVRIYKSFCQSAQEFLMLAVVPMYFVLLPVVYLSSHFLNGYNFSHSHD